MTAFIPFSHRLDREWIDLGRRPVILARVRGWRLTDRPFDSLDDFLVLTGFIPRAQRPRAVRVDADEIAADDLLVDLLTIAPHDWLAGRIVLQRIMAGLLKIAGAEQQRDPTVDAFSLLVGEAWLAIVNYRAGRGRSIVAARLLNDARHRAFTNVRRASRADEMLCPTWRIGEPRLAPERSPFDELVGVVDTARACGLSSDDMDLVRDLLGHSTEALATEGSITTRTVRYRRARLGQKIRELVA